MNNKLNKLITLLEKVSGKKVDLVKKKYEYGCVMLYFNFPELKTLQKDIDEKDLYDKPGFGLETSPHLTLLYGLHQDKIENPEEILNDLKTYLKSISLEINEASTFENEEYDVLKFKCKQDLSNYSKTKDVLFKINKELKDNYPYTSTFPNYEPHCTIAYLNSGTAKKYLKIFKDKNFKVTPSKLVYSQPIKNGTETKKISVKI